MIKRLPLILMLTVLVLTGLLSNSCKKDGANPVESQLTRGPWKLASVIVYNYTGSTNTHNDTLDAACLSYTQTFTFTADNNCTFKGYGCVDQTTKGTWRMNFEKNILFCNMKCMDSLGKTGTVIPFDTVRVNTLGFYSMVFETGDLSSVYKSTDKRQVKRLGFVRD